MISKSYFHIDRFILLSSLTAVCVAGNSFKAYGETTDTLQYLPDAYYECPTDDDHDFNAGELSVKVDGMAFFRDNEYASDIARGYTLPGVWLRPTAQYNPLDNVHLELGFSGLFFSGANKYPNYAYHDIATWKGNQYQSGIHFLPWFRAEMKLGKFDFILGDIYGGTNHHFITPLYNNEQVLSADPEMGVQVLFGSKYFKSDLYVNWQSFQFQEDTHQEAFTIGLSALLSPFNSEGWKNVSFPVAAIVQHRGGEYDTPNRGVQTLCNGSVGIAWDKQDLTQNINHLRLEANILGCMQESGKLWNFGSGIAYHTAATMTFFRNLHAELGCLYSPKDFVTLFGNPFFSTVSLKHDDEVFSSAKTAYLDFGYSHTFAKIYTLGANAEIYNANPGGGKSECVLALGLHIIVKPEFVIKRFGSK